MMRSRRFNAAASAFTLVELLVVVAIIALLVAILLPSLAGARAQARRALCAEHLAEIAKGWHMYLDDGSNRGRFLKDTAAVVNYQINYGGQQGAQESQFRVPKPLNPYLGLDSVLGRINSGRGERAERLEQGSEVFACPADDGVDTIRPSTYHGYGTSYLMNTFVVGPRVLGNIQDSDPVADALRDMSVRMATLTISNVDENHSRVVLNGDFSWGGAVLPADIPRGDWHTRPMQYNLAFLDGHVSYTRIRKGLHVTERYCTFPIRSIAARAAELQVEVPIE